LTSFKVSNRQIVKIHEQHASSQAGDFRTVHQTHMSITSNEHISIQDKSLPFDFLNQSLPMKQQRSNPFKSKFQQFQLLVDRLMIWVGEQFILRDQHTQTWIDFLV
jgi:hypothetical protein